MNSSGKKIDIYNDYYVLKPCINGSAVCGRLTAEIAGSNRTGRIDVCLL
jgi:hypothetical protein